MLLDQNTNSKAGRVLERGTAEYDKFVAAHSIKTHPGTRSIIVEDIHQVGSSCGFNVPYFDFKDYRPILTDHFEKMDKRYREGSEKDSMDRYWAYKNAWSMDRAPAMQRALQYGKLEKIAPIKKMVGPLASAKYRNRNSGFTIEQVLLVILISFVCGALAASWAPRVFKEVRIDVSQLQKAAIRPSFALN